MMTLQRSYQSLGLLIELNWDRGLFAGLIIVGLLVGGYFGTV